MLTSLVLLELIPSSLVLPFIWFVLRVAKAKPTKQREFSPIVSDGIEAQILKGRD
jgi:hypothetical protein